MYKYILIILLSTQLCFAIETQQLVFSTEELENEENLSEDNFIHDKKIATIQVLNKITAKTKLLDIEKDSEIVFNSLKINVMHCWKSSPYDLSENKILLDIYEQKPDQIEYTPVFYGWMFSSSPSISSIEHPVYDIVAIDCSN